MKWQSEVANGWAELSSQRRKLSNKPGSGDRIAYFGQVSTPKRKRLATIYSQMQLELIRPTGCSPSRLRTILMVGTTGHECDGHQQQSGWPSIARIGITDYANADCD